MCSNHYAVRAVQWTLYNLAISPDGLVVRWTGLVWANIIIGYLGSEDRGRDRLVHVRRTPPPCMEYLLFKLKVRPSWPETLYTVISQDTLYSNSQGYYQQSWRRAPHAVLADNTLYSHVQGHFIQSCSRTLYTVMSKDTLHSHGQGHYIKSWPRTLYTVLA